MVGAHWSFGFEVLHDAMLYHLHCALSSFRVVEPSTHGFGVFEMRF